MLPHSTVPSNIGLIPIDLVHKIQAFLDESSSVSNSSKHRSISATFTTFDNRMTTVDLNVCRPSLTPHSRRVAEDKEEKNLEGLIIVWLDPSIKDMEENNEKRAIHLRQIINCYEEFSGIEQCLKYVRSIKEEKIFLIMSVSLAKAAINDLNKSSQVVSIYVRCSEKRFYENWAKNHPKIRGLFATEYDLSVQITKDVTAFFRNDLFVSITDSFAIGDKLTEHISKDQANFMWSQILIEILLRLPQAPRAKEELIHECRRHYRNNNYQQNKITEFEKNYNSTNALSWYTRDSFIYRFVNRALRTRNIFYIFKCRFFIVDIHQQVAKVHRKLLNISKEKVVTVYRGQLMSTDELTKLKDNVNGFISTNTFFWTSRSSKVALDFAGDGSRRPLFESVYFEIDIGLDIAEGQLTNSNKISHFASDDDELLLCMGTVFRIATVEPMNNCLWYIKLVLISEDETVKLNNLKNYLTKELDNPSSYLALGRILLEIGEYDKMRTYYELILGELPLNHSDMASIHSSLGLAIILSHKDSKLALAHLTKSLALQLEISPIKILLLMQTLNAIAGMYVERRNFTPGLTLYQILRELLDNLFVRDKDSPIFKRQGELYNNIGSIYSKLGRLSLSLKYYKMSLKVNRKILPSNHPTIALLLSNIGLVHVKKRDSETSEKYLEEANKIQQESTQFEYHPDIIKIYDNLGTAQFFRRNFNKALLHFEKALDIQLKYLPPIHPNTAMLYISIGNVLFEKKNNLMALKMYENSLKLGQQCWPLFHPEMSVVYTNIGKVCRCLGNYERALSYCQKALEIGLKCLPPTDTDLAEAYKVLGQVYGDTNNHPMAVLNLQKAIHIYIKNPPIDQEYLGILYDDLGRQHYDDKQYQAAIKCLEKALSIYETCNKEESSLAVVYFDLGKAYYQNNEHHNALLNYNKSIQIEMEHPSKCNMQRLSQKYYAVGETYQKLTEYKTALKSYTKALELVLKDDSVSTNSNKSILIRKYRNSIQIVKTLL